MARWFVSFFRFFCGKYARQRPRPRTSSRILLAVFYYFLQFFFKRTVLQLLMHSSAILHTLCSCNSYLIQIYIWTKTNHIICHVVGTLCLSMREHMGMRVCKTISNSPIKLYSLFVFPTIHTVTYWSGM